MKERASPADGWNPEILDHALASFSVPRVHAAYGEGRRYPIGDAELPTADLEVFPMARIVRYSTPTTQITLFDQDPPIPTDDGLAFHHSDQHEQRALLLSDQGEVTVFVTPNYLLPNLTAPSETSTPKPQTEVVVEPLSEPPPPSVPDQPPATVPARQEQREQQQRLVLRGRAINNPTLTHSPRAIPIATFGLAVGEGEDRIVHNVLAFKDRAAEVMDVVQIEQPLRVIGYRHLRALNGSPEPVEEVFAVSVRPDQTTGE